MSEEISESEVVLKERTPNPMDTDQALAPACDTQHLSNTVESEVVLKERTPNPMDTDQALAPACDTQHLSNTVESSQNGEEPESEWREEHNRERSEKCISTENDCKDTSYSYHYDSEMKTLPCNINSLTERTTHHPTVTEKCNQEEEETTLLDNDKDYTNYCNNKQINHNDDSSNADQDQPKYFELSEEHTYPRKEKVILSSEPRLEMSYSYCTARESINNPIAETYPERRCFIQVENLPVVNQCGGKNYEYLKDLNSYENGEMSHDNREMCNIKEYDYGGGAHVYRNENQDACQDTYYNYKLHDEGIYQSETTDSLEKLPSQEHHHIYQPDETKFFNRDELTSTTECENCHDRGFNYTQNNINSTVKTSIMSEEESYQELNLQDTNVLSQEDNDFTRKDDDNHQKNESSAVDLRIVKPSRCSELSVESQSSSNNIQKPVNNSHLPDNLCHIDDPRENSIISQTKLDQENNSSRLSYIIPDQICYEEEYSKLPYVNETFDCSIRESKNIEDNSVWDAATNTEPTTVEDKESQTGSKEMKDVAVQTDTKPTILPFAFLKNIQEDIVKYTCPICQRVYISKHSFDRHLKTHEKERTNNVIANVRFTTEAKLQICKRAGKSKHLMKTHNPIIIQVPRSIIQCGMCERNFPNQREKDNHDCICKLFPLTKCPECHIKFYTTGALNEHIGIVHKKENAYYCIFCNKSFNDGYNFHLHLDEHLSMQ